MPCAAIRSTEMRTESILLDLAMWEQVAMARIYHCMEVFCWKEVQKDGAVAGGGRIQRTLVFNVIKMNYRRRWKYK